MPEKDAIERARKDAAKGKSPSTQAGEFVHEESHARPRRQARRDVDHAGDRRGPGAGHAHAPDAHALTAR